MKFMTLREYCTSKNITMQKLSKETDISYSYLRQIQDKVNPSVTASFMVKMYQGTKKSFGKGLEAEQYTLIK